MTIQTQNEKLIAALNADKKLYEEFRQGWLGWGFDSIEDYLDEYSHIPDIAERLAGDLGIDLNAPASVSADKTSYSQHSSSTFLGDDGGVIQRVSGLYTENQNNVHGRWVLLSPGDGALIDMDRYINDLAERNNIELHALSLDNKKPSF